MSLISWLRGKSRRKRLKQENTDTQISLETITSTYSSVTQGEITRVFGKDLWQNAEAIIKRAGGNIKEPTLARIPTKMDHRQKKPSDPLREKAESLFFLAHMSALSALTPLLERCDSPMLRHTLNQRSTDGWDFFFTAACVFVALSTLDQHATQERVDSLSKLPFAPSPREGSASKSGPMKTASDIIEGFKEKWEHCGEAAVLDCSDFVESRMKDTKPENAKDTFAVLLGMWVLWNVYEEAPKASDSELAGAIGHLIATTFAPYWR